jgi:hypothetical protein
LLFAHPQSFNCGKSKRGENPHLSDQVRHLESRAPFETLSIELANGRVIQIHERHSVATTNGTRPEEARDRRSPDKRRFEVINANQVVSVSAGLHPEEVRRGRLTYLAKGDTLPQKGNRIFRRIGTNTRPSQPTLALVTTGIFTWTRNPMYFGGCLALLGIAIGFALDWVILLLAASLPLVHYGIILREERYLERKFGDEYRRYQKKVPRYWWRF